MRTLNLHTALYLMIFSLCSWAAGGQTNWQIDKSHSKISFNVAHMVVSEVTGQFHEYDGTIVAAKDDFSDAKIDMKIKVKSIDTDDEDRDEHLRSADFFDADKFPEISFTAKDMKKVGDKKYALTGTMTMHGVTKEVTLDVTFAGRVKDMRGHTRAGFKIRGVINREDYGLEYNAVLEAGGLAIGNEVELVCNMELVKS